MYPENSNQNWYPQGSFPSQSGSPQYGAWQQPAPQQPNQQTDGAYWPQQNGQYAPQQSWQSAPQSGWNAQQNAWQTPQQPQQQSWQGSYQPQNPYIQPGPVPQRPVVPQPTPAQPTGNASSNGSIQPRQVFMLLLCVAAPLCFLLGMLVPGLGAFKWIFLVIAVLGLALVWVGSLMKRNNRVFLTLIYLLLIGITVFSLVSAPVAASDLRNAAQSAASGGESGGSSEPQTESLPAMDTVDQAPDTQTTAPASQTTAPASMMANEMLDRLGSFMYFWSVNDVDSMLGLCAPSWARQQTGQNGAETALFVLLQNRTPIDWDFITMTGTDSDVNRTVTMQATIDRHWYNTAPALFQFKVVMMKESDVWYVDPRTLGSNEVTPTPYVSAEITQPPQPATNADASTVLYYNPDGGQFYHIDAYCQSAAAKNLPFKGQFTYGELDNEPYKSLLPCTACGAPLHNSN